MTAADFRSHLSTHQARAAAAGARVIFHTRVLQTWLTVLPEGLCGLVTHRLLFVQLLLHLLCDLQGILKKREKPGGLAHFQTVNPHNQSANPL